MSTRPLAIVASGMVTSVGVTAPAACAAIRAGLTNPSKTRFFDPTGESLMSHAVTLEQPWRGRMKLAQMAALAMEECLGKVPREDWADVPILLCLAESGRPERLEGLDVELYGEICGLLGTEFAASSLTIAHGRVSFGVALLHARRTLYDSDVPVVVIVGTDGLIHWPTLRTLEQADRLLNGDNSNGFLPGEGAAAVLVSKPSAGPELRIEGLGFATEAAHIGSDEPLRGEGLTAAIKAALQDAGCEMHDVDFRITDLSGEQYYFKEAALALSRTLRRRKVGFELWHPAECIGETGSAIGPVMLAVADAACRREYAVGPRILLHAANDDGQRVALVATYAGA